MQHFDKINSNFKDTFARLSTKGEATLELETPQNPFEGGIGIKVRMSGARFLDIRSLSGGEKTMTALAFIFSIQDHEPASFYILDEVDAALDKNNSEKLAKLIQKYSEKAQYIIISHNDGVITTANTLPAIPMPLQDRMEIIRIPGYTELEKLKIATIYLIRKQIEANGITAKNINFTDLYLFHAYIASGIATIP